jgi:hypothetical protein
VADEAEAMMCSVLGPAQAGEEGERMIAAAEARGTYKVRENGELAAPGTTAMSVHTSVVQARCLASRLRASAEAGILIGLRQRR